MRGRTKLFYGCCVTAIAVALPMLATAQEDEQETQESVPAAEIQEAPVVAPTQLEDAPVVPASEVGQAPVVPATGIEEASGVAPTQLEDASVVPASEVGQAPVVPATEVEGAQVAPATELEDAEVAPATELEQAPVVPLTEIEEVVVTGSRIARTPEELAGNLIVLDGDFIRASGEATLERVLRQLPQNANATTESFGNNLNNVANFTGASTVNLRGLGSESTLILVDGKRIGYSGFLGGVTDVSTIPLALVERIEVLLDGASAVYGSDAVGGVINIITRRDYEGAELDLNYNQPGDGSYNEWRGSISGGFNLGGTRVRASYTHSEHSGLDGADRELTLFERSKFPGPQFDIRFCCLADGTGFPVLYRLDGDVLTVPEYRALAQADKDRATGVYNAVLPVGFNENSSVDDITEFGLPDWGAETQSGYHVLPENRSDGVSLSFDRDFTANFSGEFRARYETRDTTYNQGYFQFGDGVTLNRVNPFNPFDRNVHIRAQRRDLPAPSTLTGSDTLDLGIDLDGSIGGSGWEWEATFGVTTQDANSRRLNSSDVIGLTAGLGSDGVTPRRGAFIGFSTREACEAEGNVFTFGFCFEGIPPPPAANPFGDLTPYIIDTLHASSTNEQTRFDALLRGSPWTVPAGDVSVLLGVSSQETSLKSMSEFRIGVVGSSPIGDIASFDTDASRSNRAGYLESLVPLIGGNSAQDLSLSLSGRWDSYGAPDVVYRDSADGTTERADDLPDAGSASTWGTGLVFSPVQSVRLRANWQTSFVAPQLNQLLRRTSENETRPYRGLLVQLPNGNLSQQKALVIEGGNPDLKSETADTLNLGVEYNAPSGLGLKVTWNQTDYMDRINHNVPFIIDRENLPSSITILPGDPDDPTDDIWIQERRFINVASVLREGVDFQAYYTHAAANGDFSVQLWHSRTSKYDVVVDTAIDEVISVLGHRDGTNTVINEVPESSTTAQFTWAYRGFEAGLDISTSSGTGSTLAGVTNNYSPPTIADLTLIYNFVDGGLLGVPDWAEGARLSLTVNNLGDDFGTVRTVDAEGMVLEGNNTNPSPVYGRVLNLSVHMSL